MSLFWQRVFKAFSRKRRTHDTLSLKERFAHFITIGTANDRFLNRLSNLIELQTNKHPIDMATVNAGYETLSDAVETMVSSLIMLAPGRYQDLPGRFVTIQQEVAREVLKARMIEDLPLVVWPDDLLAKRHDVVGGKASTLVTLHSQANLFTPSFFVVTAHAYHYFLEACGIQDQVQELLAANDSLQSPILRSHCDEIRRAILTAKLPKMLSDAIRLAHHQLRGSQRIDYGVAVRSSALVEDGKFSFAGQFETVLGVREDGLLEAYKRVVASKYRYETFRYTRMSGYLDEEIAIPVIFMNMVQPLASGVAYSRDPGGGETVIVSAVRGLAEAIVSGRIIPDRYVVDRKQPQEILEQRIMPKQSLLRCSEKGGVLEVPILKSTEVEETLRPAAVTAVARLALSLEQDLGKPQDVEWAIDDSEKLYVIQSRPLRINIPLHTMSSVRSALIGVRVLIASGQRACGGIAYGRVFRLLKMEDLEGVPENSILVVPTTSPRLSGLIGHVAAIIADMGSPTGHLATVAREFKIPTIVGTQRATKVLLDGMLVTIDATVGKVYEGKVPELLALQESSPPDVILKNTASDCLKRLLDRTAPLSLQDPRSQNFTVENCRTLHDIARFVHQSAIAEIFAAKALTARERREARQLHCSVPMELLVLDLGGGVAEKALRVLELQDITSLPFSALLEGMTDPRLRWSGPVGFDLKGFMSLVVRSAADDQRYGEPSYAICARDYVHFSSRLAYHFATVDAMCTLSANQNYARFMFFGGAAIAERREWRAHFLTLVLRVNGFETTRVCDRVEAFLGKRNAEAVEKSLVLLGRLMAATRHLDMVMDSQTTAEAYAAAFIDGDFGFEFVRDSHS